MGCCFELTKNLCLLDGCQGDINILMEAPDAGQYTLHLKFLGVVLIVIAVFEVGEEIIFHTDKLNENYQYEGNIIGPDGSAFSLVINGENFDSIKFTTTSFFNI